MTYVRLASGWRPQERSAGEARKSPEVDDVGLRVASEEDVGPVAKCAPTKAKPGNSGTKELERC
jgi:hypothetical protein